MSLSARRAWIEMLLLQTTNIINLVALRKESVDRNIQNPAYTFPVLTVALRKESVDRNKLIAYIALVKKRRSPQGERG